jgi:hypothetical protein
MRQECAKMNNDHNVVAGRNGVEHLFRFGQEYNQVRRGALVSVTARRKGCKNAERSEGMERQKEEIRNRKSMNDDPPSFIQSGEK